LNKYLSRNEFSGDESVHLLILEVFKTDLGEDIISRKKAKKPFTEDELWDMADNLISALAYL